MVKLKKCVLKKTHCDQKAVCVKQNNLVLMFLNKKKEETKILGWSSSQQKTAVGEFQSLVQELKLYYDCFRTYFIWGGREIISKSWEESSYVSEVK